MPVRFEGDVKSIFGNRVGSNAALALANQIRSLADKRVPFSTGTLKNTATVSGGDTSATITYIQPYARYLYYGKVMVGKMPKKLTDKNLTYQYGPQRGSFWMQRTLNEDKADIEDFIYTNYGAQIKWK